MMWALSLTGFGSLGLFATFAPRKHRVWGLALEALCRFGLTLAPMIYAAAIVHNVGWSNAIAVVVTYAGIAFINSDDG